jgi:hypothetical protein
VARAGLIMARKVGGDHQAVLARLATPLALTAVLIPFRSGLPNTGAEGLPGGTGTELPVEAGGRLQGRFLLAPGSRVQLPLEQRLVAVALADQAAAALASGQLASRR